MTLSEKILALHARPPFSQLKTEELLIAATAFSPRSYKPGTILCSRGETINKLYVRVSGNLVDDQGRILQSVVGTTCLLTGQPTPFSVFAGSEGYQGLLLPRGKFFTLINECPALLTGFFRIPLLGIDYGLSTTSETR
jgi:CRP-like cAMP-binding protein